MTQDTGTGAVIGRVVIVRTHGEEVCSFLRAAMTKYYELGVLNSRDFLSSEFWRIEVQDQGDGGSGSFRGLQVSKSLSLILNRSPQALVSIRIFQVLVQHRDSWLPRQTSYSRRLQGSVFSQET